VPKSKHNIEGGLGLTLCLGELFFILNEDSQEKLTFQYVERRGNEARFKILAPLKYRILREKGTIPPDPIPVERDTIDLICHAVDLLGTKAVKNAVNEEAARELTDTYLGVRNLLNAIRG
jgi:hypothetical protein